MTLLGETPARFVSDGQDAEPRQEQDGELPAKARSWMKQYGLSMEQISEVFHSVNEGVDVIASIPGKTKKDQVRNAYVLLGIKLPAQIR